MNGRYIEFLEAIASIDDTHGLCEAEGPGGHRGMDGQYGGVERIGAAGSDTYVVKDGDIADLRDWSTLK